MISDPLLLAFPNLLETKSELFSTEDLQDLDRTLAPLENNPPENAEEILRNWCKVRRSIRDELITFFSRNRKELGKVPPTQPIQQARLSNWFQELRQQVKDKLKSESNKNNTNDL